MKKIISIAICLLLVSCTSKQIVDDNATIWDNVDKANSVMTTVLLGAAIGALLCEECHTGELGVRP